MLQEAFAETQRKSKDNSDILGKWHPRDVDIQC
jgi:hypothetical protein